MPRGAIMVQSRKRIQFKFWLDIVKDDEYALAEEAIHLKNRRGFSRTIRDGLRLILDLRAGQVDVLFELFPWVKDKLVSQTTHAPTTAIEAQLQRLEAALTAQGATPIDIPHAATGPKQLATPKLSAPIFDDDDDQDTVVLKRNTSTDAAQNLFSSMMGLQR
jgi:hypothetical protein